MRKKQGKQKENYFFTYFITLLVTPLFFLKWIGDSLIRFGAFFIKAELKTYNIFSAFITTQSKKHKLLKKRSVIYSKGKKWAEKKEEIEKKINKFLSRELSLPAVKIPKQIKLFFLKAKYFFFGACVVGIGVSMYQLNVTIDNLPNPHTLTTRDIPATTKLLDRKGRLLYEIYREQDRTFLGISDVPQKVKNATIAIEDREFYRHQGFSVRGILRAILRNAMSGSFEGGSTITQQLIRAAFLTPEKTYARKIKEIVLSVWAEQIYGKDQILEMYLNQVPYGGTAWGIEAASQTYFGKSVTKLSLAESALLAGLPAAPTLYSPFGAHPLLAKKRQEEVLDKMHEEGYINAQETEEAKKEKLTFKTPRIAIAAPHFVMYVKELLEQYYGERLVANGGLRVTTTLDLDIQNMAQNIVSSEIDSLRNLSVGNGAAVITDPKTGEILSLVGSRDYFDKEHQGNVNVALSLRQPGSSIKVVTYAAALMNGFTAASILNDAPVVYRTAGESYAPVNYDGKFHGSVPLRVALASSYNIPAVKTLAAIGIEKMIETGKRMGITTWEDKERFGLSLTLGGGEVTMLDVAKVYGTLANHGVKQEITPFLKITNYKGESIPLPYIPPPVAAISKDAAFILSSILSDNSARTPAFGPNSALVIPGKTVAVKTGTSDNKRDNWTIGYTDDFVTAVWVGNNDNSPMHPTLTSGITGAAPIWQKIMKELLKDTSDKPFIQGENIIRLACYGRQEYFISGTQPKGGCPRLSPPSPTPTK